MDDGGAGDPVPSGAPIEPVEAVEVPERFGLAPPRRFLLPALLLLLAERPSHGYQLVAELRRLRFGAVDRPSVYRALAQLEADGLVVPTAPAEVRGRARRVYELSAAGAAALRSWMTVVREERDALDRVLRRYAATDAVDAIVSEAATGPFAAPRWSPVSPTVETDPGVPRRGGALGGPGHDARGRRRPSEPRARRFHVVPAASAVLVEARSTVGPITFGAVGIEGHVECVVSGEEIVQPDAVRARLELEMRALRSGNSLYDAELLRRVDARRYPRVTVELTGCAPLGTPRHYRVGGDVELHGVRVAMEGTVQAALTPRGDLVVEGEQVFDIRDFDIASPTILMLRIYPDVVVRLHAHAAPEPEQAPGPDLRIA